MTQFFKIILSTVPKLRIPHKFVREHENSLPSKVSLEAPYGPSWQIELIRFNGEIWMDKGFEQFMEYYSIRLGYLLLFRYYYEDLCFRVIIFDTSASEIDYPVTNFEENISKQLSAKCCPQKEQNEVVVDVEELLLVDDGVCMRQKVGNGKRVEEDDCTHVSIEILEEFPTREIVEGAGMKDEGSVEFLGEYTTDKKTRRVNEVENLRIEEKGTVRKEDASQNGQSERIRSPRVKCETLEPDVSLSCAKGKTKYDCSANHHQLSCSENRAYERARAFVTRNPSFISVMRHSHIIGYLNINKAFAKEFCKGQDTRDVVLRVPGCKRTWTGTCFYGQWNTKLQWRQFVKDNGLFQGDVCVFEQGNGATLSLNVIIFRKNEY
ncbi:hypothetical protein Leryth_020628 [Lithospermum erythrorhizon]|nr:hypothetical protein Leryth_020628 [Lithospermum erythrorhizon]